MDSDPSQKRLSINLSGEAADAVDELTERRSVTITELIRRAVSTQKYVDDAVLRGARILVEEPEGTIKELVFIL